MIPRLYQTTVTEFKKKKDGTVCSAVLVSLEPKKDEKTGRLSMVPIEGTQKEIPVDLVLIAAGFLGSEGYVAESFGVKLNARTNVETVNGSYRTGKEKIFTAGDMHRGQSLVVWAIARRQGSRKGSGQVVDGIHLRVTPHRISSPKADRACTKKAFGLETRRSIRKFTTTIQGTGGQTVR